MRYQGTINHWKDEQGFGFITPDNGGKPVFAHATEFRQRRPFNQEVVTYEVRLDAQKRPQAINIRFAAIPSPQDTDKQHDKIYFALVALFFVSLAGMVYLGKLPMPVLGFYALISLLTLVVYATDKDAARKQRWRTPENTLHLLALAGGWAGALVAQRLLHHKSRKQPFQSLFWITVICNTAALAWLFSSNFDNEWLRSIGHSSPPVTTIIEQPSTPHSGHAEIYWSR
jgi:uncharacterized membrane protein YsdA (DUF1294 family)/cold shock CspA family protein